MYKKNYSNTKTAKLDRELMFNIGNGSLDISANAINFIFATITHVAKDGRIYCDMNYLRSRLFMQQKTLKRVIVELTLAGLVSEKDGFLYSHFHVLSSGEKEDKSYVQNIEALTSEYVSSLHKTKKRFFLYVASFSRMGVPKTVSVEALYNNKYHSGVNYVEGYQELAEILFEFVQKGYFVLYINGKRYDYTSNDFQEVFHTYCGYDKETGKKRMAKTREHKIAIQIHEQLIGENKVVPNTSSMMEFKYFAEHYNIYHELLRPETIPFFISLQNELFNKLGDIGLQLYRNGLISYFSKEEENVLYHDLLVKEKETKAANYMMDFHLIKEVQKIIVKALASGCDETIEVEGFTFDKTKLGKLIHYFMEKSSDNQKILLDTELSKNNVSLKDYFRIIPEQNEYSNHLILLYNRIQSIYKRFDFDVEDNIISKEQQRKIVQDWATKGILVKEKETVEAVKALKKKVLFLTDETKPTFQIKETKTRNNSSKKTPEIPLNILEREERLKAKGFLNKLEDIECNY